MSNQQPVKEKSKMDFGTLKREDLKDVFGRDETEMEEALWLILQAAVQGNVGDLRTMRLSTSLAGIGSPASIGLLRLMAGGTSRYLTIDRSSAKSPLVPTQALSDLVAGLFRHPVFFSGGGPLNGQTLLLGPDVLAVSVECRTVSRSPRYRVMGNSAELSN